MDWLQIGTNPSGVVGKDAVPRSVGNEVPMHPSCNQSARTQAHEVEGIDCITGKCNEARIECSEVIGQWGWLFSSVDQARGGIPKAHRRPNKADRRNLATWLALAAS